MPPESEWPAVLRGRVSAGARADAAVAAFEEAGGAVERAEVRDLVATLAEHAPALLPLALSDTTLPADVLARPLDRDDSDEGIRRAFLDATRELDDGPDLRRALRRSRHRALVRIALREVYRLADVDQTSHEMAALASAAIDAAVVACRRTTDRSVGVALDPRGARIPFTVLGMGKLGGDELNLGSDVDLIYFYGTDDGTVDGDDVSVHELFAKLATRVTKAIADATEDGFCFRVDLRLRPEGSRGPLVNSLASAERYYEAFGRTWERAAMLRARPIAGDVEFGRELLEALRGFVYRRTVDPSIAREMAQMLDRGRQELHGDVEHDIKIGRGGIREVEFFVQALQLIWGGIHPELQTPSTTIALRRLRTTGLIQHRAAMDLGQDWALLRRVEHRIHMRAGYQTHQLPPPGEGRDHFASSLGLADGAALDAALDAARDRVHALFASLDPDYRAAATTRFDALLDRVAQDAPSSEIAALVEALLPVQDPDEAATHLHRLARHAASPVGPVGRERTPELAPLLLEEIAGAAYPDAALRFVADFFTHLPFGYERLLADRPEVTRRLVNLFGASSTLSSALIGHPELIDEVLALRSTLPSAQEIRELHDEPPLARDAPGEPEEVVGALRRLKHEITLRIGLAHTADEASFADVQDRLTALADAQIAAALRIATAEIEARLGRPERPDGDDAPAAMVVVGMGKLGSRELGFGSDLDLVFLYGAEGTTDRPDGNGVTHGELFAKIAQRTMRLLSDPAPEGTGWATDTRLRPSGSHGLLVVSLEAFDRYHASQGAAWERQALVRARAVAGDPTLARLADERFAKLAYESGAPPAEEVARMRRRIEEELSGERATRFHPKLGHGALVDVEFAVQWLQMKHGAKHARVRCRGTLDALDALEVEGLLAPRDAEALRGSFEVFRSIEQALKLLDETREPVLVVGGPVADRVARRLRLRERDGVPPAEVLVHTWIRRATETRQIFDRLVAPVGARAPWDRAG